MCCSWHLCVADSRTEGRKDGSLTACDEFQTKAGGSIMLMGRGLLYTGWEAQALQSLEVLGDGFWRGGFWLDPSRTHRIPGLSCQRLPRQELQRGIQHLGQSSALQTGSPTRLQHVMCAQPSAATAVVMTCSRFRLTCPPRSLLGDSAFGTVSNHLWHAKRLLLVARCWVQCATLATMLCMILSSERLPKLRHVLRRPPLSQGVRGISVFLDWVWKIAPRGGSQ